MKDRIPGAPGQYTAVISQAELQKLQNAEQFTITLTRDDQPLVEGTPYSKATVLPEEVASVLCPDLEDPTPADAFQAVTQHLLNKENPHGATASQIGAAPCYDITVNGAISCQTVADAIINGNIPANTVFMAKIRSYDTNPAFGVAAGATYGSGPHATFTFMHYGNNTLYKCRLVGTELTIKEL